MIKNLFLLVFTFCLFTACNNEKVKDGKVVDKPYNPLPSFNEGMAKANILSFVNRVTDPNHVEYVKPEDRIACFDNDGTLWVEQPLPSQIYFAFDRIKQIGGNNPSLVEKQPFKAIVEDDMATIKTFATADIVNIVGTAHSVDDVDKFDVIVDDWLRESMHPVMKRPYTELVYQPMLELLDLLREKEFKIYIVSGGSQEFMRVYAPATYGIPKEQIIGSTFKKEVNIIDGNIKVGQSTAIDFNDDHEGKIISISKFIGKKPIMVVGNSDGDLEMMKYCDSDNPLSHLLVYVKHTDGEREFLYDDQTLAGKLIKGEEVAKENGWTIIDMKSDWKTVFPSM